MYTSTEQVCVGAYILIPQNLNKYVLALDSIILLGSDKELATDLGFSYTLSNSQPHTFLLIPISKKG